MVPHTFEQDGVGTMSKYLGKPNCFVGLLLWSSVEGWRLPLQLWDFPLSPILQLHSLAHHLFVNMRTCNSFTLKPKAERMCNPLVRKADKPLRSLAT